MNPVHKGWPMNRTLAFVLVALFTVSGSAGGQQAPTAAPPSGHWVGSIEVGPGISVEVDLGRQGDLWRGTISIPSQGTKGIPLSDLVVKSPSVGFAIKGAPGDPRFKGELSQDGKTIAGTFSQGGGDVPLTLAWKGDAQFDTAKKNAAVSKALLGTWEGALDIQGKTLRLVLTLDNGPDGATGKLVSLDQNNFEMPVTTIVEEGPRLKLTISMVSGGFDGELKGSEIAGTWTQGPGSLPLTFKRQK
jgi:uncharacterized protein